MNDAPQPDDFDLRDYLRPVWRRKWLIVLLVVVVAAGTYVVSDRKTKTFQSSSSVLVEESNDSTLLNPAGSTVITAPNTTQDTADQAQLLRSRAVAADVKVALRTAQTASQLQARIQIASDSSTNFITITAKGPTGKSAANLANAYATAFVTERRRNIESQLFDARKQAGDQLAALEGNGSAVVTLRQQLRSRIRQLKAVGKTPDGGARQVDSAVVPGEPVSPRPKRNAGFGALLALLVGIMLALLAERVDRRVRDGDDFEVLYGRPVLATVPHADHPTPQVDGFAALSSELREPMRMLRANLALQTLDKPIQTLLVTSAMPAEGKSTVARNLAMAMSESGTSTIVVEADLRLPTLAQSVGVSPGAGLSDVLAGSSLLDESIVDLDLADEAGAPVPGTFAVLPAGAAASNPAAALGSARMRELIAELSQRYDMVLIDSPPLLSVSDTLALLPIAQNLLLTGRVGISTRDAVRRVNDVLDRSPGCRVVGVVADDVNVRGRDAYAYGYGYGGGSPAGRDANAREPQPAK